MRPTDPTAVDEPLPSPLRAALGPQLAGLVAAALLVATVGAPAWALALVQGGVAATVAAVRGAPRWWWWIHLGFGPLAWGAQQLGWPAWAWGLAFVLAVLVFWRTDTSRVPLYLSNAVTVQALAALLPPEPVTVADLGCGDARVLRQLARLRPDCQFVGWEHAPLTALWARLASLRQPQVRVVWGSFWDQPLQDYALVYAFLSPAPMPRLWDKAQAEMAPGAVLVSNSFAVPGQKPQRRVRVDDRRATELWVYQPRRADS